MNGFTFILNIIYTGISTILISILKVLNKIFKNKFDKPINKLLEKNRPEAILLACIYILSFTTIFSLVYSPGQKVVDLSKNDDIPSVEEKVEDAAPKEESIIADYSYARFSKMSLDEVDFNWLKSINDQTVAWISVDGTNINYPVVYTLQNIYTTIDKLIYRDFIIYYGIAEVQTDMGLFYENIETQRYLQF
jgi:hypothetical protein